ncbi:MAG: hypothetical protein RSF40_05370 [Oscillospiraceae bacterium]
MINSIKKEWNLHIDYLIFSLCIAVGVWFLTDTIVISFFAISGKSDYIVPGTFIVMIGFAMLEIMSSFFIFTQNLSLAISMGRTRKDYIIGSLVTLTIHQVIVYVLCVFLSNISGFAAQLILKNVLPDGDFWGVIMGTKILMKVLIAIAAAILGSTLLGLIGAAFTTRFGMKALWVIWAIYMIAIFAGSNLKVIVERYFSFLLKIPPYIAIIVAIIAIGAVLIYSIKVLLKASAQ